MPLTNLRKINGIKQGRGVRLGQKVKLPVNAEKIDSFNSKRIEYHSTLQEDFFNNYKIIGLVKHKVKTGDTIMSILREYEVPIWLVRRFRQRKQNFQLFKGEVLKIPVVDANI